MSKHQNFHDTVLFKNCLAHVGCRADFYQLIKVQEWTGPHFWTLIWFINLCVAVRHMKTLNIQPDTRRPHQKKANSKKKEHHETEDSKKERDAALRSSKAPMVRQQNLVCATSVGRRRRLFAPPII